MDESRSTDENSPGGLNCCHLMDPEDSFFSTVSTIVPETPSPLLGKRSRRRSVTRRLIAEAAAVSPLPTERQKKRRRVSRCSATATTTGGEGSNSESLSFLTSEERQWLNGEHTHTEPFVDHIIISDDEEATVRSLQLEEDEVFARHLQAEFDRDRWEEQSHHLHQQTSHMVFPHLQPRWVSQVLSAVSPLVDFPEDLIGHHSQRGRSRRRRNRLPDLSDDHQGNDYEALLELEERQGAVVSKKLTRQQIQRFPTKNFQTSAAGDNTQCQICFCEYSDREKLRMLPCFHDYHVQCIDRWLKENPTCPICRVNLTDVSS